MSLNATYPVARFLGTLNEKRNGSIDPNANDNIMDEYNNFVGRSYVDKDRLVVTTEQARDNIEGLVRSGVTINTLKDPRIDLIRQNLEEGETEITVGDHGIIRLEGIHASSIDESDFIFV